MEPFEIKEGSVFMSVNPKLYPLDVIYAASYVFIDKCYIILDGHPDQEVMIELKPKEEQDIQKLGYEFYNELLSYALYKSRSKKSQNIREAIVQRAILTAETSKQDDPEGISVPIKHGANH
ncbi:MAG: His-Xaa-Ser system protein HxsD [Candidatus Nanoarchaeia archaeon]